MKCLVIYSSSTGNTKAVANYIASKTGGKAIDAKAAKPEDLEGFDAVVFGSRVHAGSVSKPIVNFINNNRDRISGMKNAFFACCSFNDDKGDSQLRDLADRLGFSTAAYFNKGKKLAETGEQIDGFIAKL